MRRFLACLLLVAACADGGDVVTDEAEVSPDLDAKADSQAEALGSRGRHDADGHQVVARRDGANGPEFVLRGKTTRT